MKTTLAIILLILLGIGLGLGITAWRVKTATWNPAPYENAGATGSNAQANQPTPKAFVEKAEFNFGKLDITASGSHDFIIANRGRSPLTLAVGETSCRCTGSKLERENVPPGESAKVTITWKPKEAGGPYHQTAKIETNDPNRRFVTLTISGEFTVAAQFVPAELTFSRVTIGESAIAQARLFCNVEKSVKILGHTWENAETAPLFDVAFKPMAEDAVKSQPGAKGGWLIDVTAKPGLPQGSFRQKLILQTDLKAAPTQTLPIQGTVGSEIGIIGKGWDEARDFLDIGLLSGNAGATRRLLLIVRGPLRKQVTFKVAQIEPKCIQATLGEPKALSQGVVQTPLVVKIPPGSPATGHLGGEQGPMGEILLETTHPKVPKLIIRVRFAVEGNAAS